ncbi:MAG TPA: 3-oxoacyl-[acyl-carrier-protein] synthase III C-terminal domain-containing protein [Bacteroidales bacterium]|nr:3-oxoacyl-[acyl-carrier-protein] synthase III C-terminal domain-containing protein [Bacteroidales bacterium]
MGTTFDKMDGYFEFSGKGDLPERSRQVLHLTEKPLQTLINSGLPGNLSHLIVATTCPDSLAPSLGQTIIEKYSAAFSSCHSIDIVQGCAGGVTSLILGSQLAELNKSSVMVVCADAARKSTSKSSKINKIFGNGSFACLISYQDSEKGLSLSKSHQYKGLSEVVNINLGHDADQVIMKESKTIIADPRKHLGLRMNNYLAIKLLRNAERFYLDFIEHCGKPDIMILHQVNPMILKHLSAVFKKHQVEFINVVEETGNCGVASVGVALNSIKETIKDKKVFLCSFGTGGVITAGLWNN